MAKFQTPQNDTSIPIQVFTSASPPGTNVRPPSFSQTHHEHWGRGRGATQSDSDEYIAQLCFRAYISGNFVMKMKLWQILNYMVCCKLHDLLL